MVRPVVVSLDAGSLDAYMTRIVHAIEDLAEGKDVRAVLALQGVVSGIRYYIDTAREAASED